MMNRKELDSIIYQLTERERENLLCKMEDPDTVETGRHIREAEQYTADQFMQPIDKLRVNKQDRFEMIAPHKHDYIELCYVWSGSCEQEIEGKKIVTQQGDVCIFDTQAVHSVAECKEQDIIVNIMMKKEFFDAAFLSRMTKQGIVSEFLVDAVTKSRQRKHYLYFPSHKNPHVHEIMERIMMEHYAQDLGMHEVMESYVIILFTELLRTWRDESREKESVSKEVQVLELLAYIEEHYEDCRLPDMGKAFGMHGNYLTALLKEKTGKSFVEHVQDQKLKKAKSLLENTKLPIAELIPLCGYNNLNFFYKKFREEEGCTPAQYRKRNSHSESFLEM